MTHSCDKVGLDYFETAPVKFTLTEIISATPEEIFAIFLDAESWTKWVFAIKKVEWTSPFPLEVGSTRTVFMLGGMTGYEEFIAWEPGVRMAFRFNESSKKAASAFAENYQVTDLGDGTCRVEWVMALTPAGAGKRTMPVAKPIMRFFLKKTLADFRKYVETKPVLTPTP